MLVLSRKLDESIIINGNIEVIVTAIGSNQVRLGISAPPNVSVHRKEVQQALDEGDLRKRAVPPPARNLPWRLSTTATEKPRKGAR